MEAVVNYYYGCLRQLYDEEQFYVEAGGYCGPGTATINPDSEGEEELGLRCSETNCCGEAEPVEDEESEEVTEEMSEEDMETAEARLEIYTCQPAADTVTYKTQFLQANPAQDWNWTCKIEGASYAAVGILSVVVAALMAFI